MSSKWMTDVMNGMKGSQVEMTVVGGCNLAIERRMRTRWANDTDEVQLHLDNNSVEECVSKRMAPGLMNVGCLAEACLKVRKGRIERWVEEQERPCALIAAGIPWSPRHGIACFQVQPIRTRVLTVFGLLKAASTPAFFGHPNISTEILLVILRLFIKEYSFSII